MKVAIMQPYFIPYTGYFRLLYGVDVFVAYDCVQYSRRGYIHRNKLVLESGKPDWLTLPVEKASRDTLIKDMAFKEDAGTILRNRMRRFPYLLNEPKIYSLVEKILDIKIMLAPYLIEILKSTCQELGISVPIIRSSEFNIDKTLMGVDRIMAVLKNLNADHYINAPGGRNLYPKDFFTKHGIKLTILPEFNFSNTSILYRLYKDNKRDILKELKY